MIMNVFRKYNIYIWGRGASITLITKGLFHCMYYPHFLLMLFALKQVEMGSLLRK